MKKRINILFILVLVALLTSTITTYAMTGFISFLGITLPAFQGEVVAGAEEKGVDIDYQHYKNTGTISGFLGKEEPIMAKVKGLTGTCSGQSTVFITIGFGELSGWDAGTTCTGFKGRYELTLKRAVSRVTTASHSGSWYLDEKYLP